MAGPSSSMLIKHECSDILNTEYMMTHHHHPHIQHLPHFNLNNHTTAAVAQQTTAITSTSSATTSASASSTAAHPSNATKMGSRRIFTPQFKLQVLDSYRNDGDCKGNQRATARKYGIHRRQIQKWLQCESNLRSSVLNGSGDTTAASCSNNSNNNNIMNKNKHQSAIKETSNTGKPNLDSNTSSVSSSNSCATSIELSSLVASSNTFSLRHPNNNIPHAMLNIHQHHQHLSASSLTALSSSSSSLSSSSKTGYFTNTNNTSISRSPAHSHHIDYTPVTVEEPTSTPSTTSATSTSLPPAPKDPSALCCAPFFVAAARDYAVSAAAAAMIINDRLLQQNQHTNRSTTPTQHHNHHHHHHEHQQPNHDMFVGARRPQNDLAPLHYLSVAAPHPYSHTITYRAPHQHQLNHHDYYATTSATPLLPRTNGSGDATTTTTTTSTPHTTTSEIPSTPTKPIDLSMHGRAASPSSSSSLRFWESTTQLPRQQQPTEPHPHHIPASNTISSSSPSSVSANSEEAASAPWDLTDRKRKCSSTSEKQPEAGDQNSPTPQKVVKLFKPYLMTSDEENQRAEQDQQHIHLNIPSHPSPTRHHHDDEHAADRPTAFKPLPRRQHDPIIWSNYPGQQLLSDGNNNSNPSAVAFFPSSSVSPALSAASAIGSRSPPADYYFNSPPLSSATSISHHPNHGSPVSGYDTATSSLCDSDDRHSLSSRCSLSSAIDSALPTSSSEPASPPIDYYHERDGDMPNKFAVQRDHVTEWLTDEEIQRRYQEDVYKGQY